MARRLGKRGAPAVLVALALACFLASIAQSVFFTGVIQPWEARTLGRKAQVGHLRGDSRLAAVHPVSLRAAAGIALPAAPFSPPASDGPRDFFLFIKDYGWTLRYRVGLANTDGALDQEAPLEMEWVKLLRPIRNPAELLEPTSSQLFDWSVVAPPKHQGFMYQVTRAIGNAVEAVINFFKGRDLRLLVSLERGIEILRPVAGEPLEAEPHAVTHCWVEMGGLPFLPSLQSIAFYDLNQVVLDWQA